MSAVVERIGQGELPDDLYEKAMTIRARHLKHFAETGEDTLAPIRAEVDRQLAAAKASV